MMTHPSGAWLAGEDEAGGDGDRGAVDNSRRCGLSEG